MYKYLGRGTAELAAVQCLRNVGGLVVFSKDDRSKKTVKRNGWTARAPILFIVKPFLPYKTVLYGLIVRHVFVRTQASRSTD